jgi:hypothetical protein
MKKLDNILEVKPIISYKSPVVAELKVRGLARKDCQCVVKDYVFADNEG